MTMTRVSFFFFFFAIKLGALIPYYERYFIIIEKVEVYM